MFKYESISSLGVLNNAVNYAEIPEELVQCALDSHSNQLLQFHLLDTYFPETKHLYTKGHTSYLDLFNKIENKLLNANPPEYITEIKQLLKEKDEEEIFLRGNLFKREIPKLYQNTCCISGLKIETTRNISMIDACHIVPFSTSFNDTVSNGIALSPTLHRAFDRGLIAIDKDYRVLVAKDIYESESQHSIKSFEGKPILLPENPDYRPSQDNFEWHRKRFNFI